MNYQNHAIKKEYRNNESNAMIYIYGKWSKWCNENDVKVIRQIDEFDFL